MSSATAELTSQMSLTSNGYELDSGPSRLGRLQPTPADEHRDPAALWERLRRDGYVYLPGLLDPAAMLAFRRYYFATLDDVGLLAPGTDPAVGLAATGDIDGASMRHTLFKTIVPGETYQALCTRPELVSLFRMLFEAEPFLHRRRIIRHTRPGDNGIGFATQAHYDLVYIREGTDRVLSAWIPLGDCPVTRGGLTYLEGSHHRVRRDEVDNRLRRPAESMTADLPGLADEYDTRWLVADYKVGDVIIHSPYLIHAALDNVDPDGVMRLSTDIRFQHPQQPIDWRWQNYWYERDGL